MKTYGHASGRRVRYRGNRVASTSDHMNSTTNDDRNGQRKRETKTGGDETVVRKDRKQ